MVPNAQVFLKKCVFLALLFFVAANVVAAAPSITSLSPTSGAVGASVTIAGSGFGSTQGSSTLKFNGTTATITSWSATSIVAKVPTGATTGNVVVTVAGTASNAVTFTVVPAPSITSLTPSTGAVGASVTIAGSNFGATQGSSTVKFNGTTASITSWSASSIVATVPSGATTGNVVVHASGVDSAGKSFTVVAAPSITSLSVTSGPVGTSVTITGTNFGATQGSSTVKFNGITATASSWSATSIKVTVPSGATTGNVVVHASGVDSNGVNFTVLPTPNITSLSQTSGPVGTAITVTGTNFGTTQGSSTVKFNGTAGTPTSWGGTSIVVPVPSGATTGNVVVTVSGVASNGVNFTVTTLVSIAVTPANASVISGGSQQFTATGTYSDNSTQNLTSTATWTSSATGVATINSSGLATGVGPGVATIQAKVGTVSGATSLAVVGFKTTGSLVVARAGATATQLNNGLVLVVGGTDATGNPLASAELYNSSTGVFAATGSLTVARSGFTATLLPDGTVLIAGGLDSSGNLLASAELFSPGTGTFSTVGGMNFVRATHTATVLPSGKVLLAGGMDSNGNGIASAELYDPASGTFTSTANMNAGRRFQTATLLNNGKVLVAGGSDSSGNTVSSAELYDPVAGTFTTINSMNAARFTHTATLLNNGQVLIAGGYDQNINTLASAELYDPIAGTFTLTGNLIAGRGSPTATLLSNGQVLFVGGTNQGVNVADAELYDPVAGTFAATVSPSVARYVQTATLLNNGMVLIAGGSPTTGGPYSSAELYQPASFVPSNLVSMALNPANPTIPSGTPQKLTAIGTLSNSTQQTLNSATWSSSNSAVVTVSSDASNQGIAYGIAAGSATISACTGSICGSTTVTVITPDPDISALSPTSGPVGSALTITGSGFGAMEGKSVVTLNQSQATATSWSPTSIVISVPNDTSGDISVQVGGVNSNLVFFTVLPTPSISNVTPASGDIGAPIEIDGTNFGDTQAASTVTLSGVPVTVTSWSATTILGTVPQNATSGNVVVNVGGVASNAVSFAVTSVPAIFGLSPNQGPIGTQVTILGADFGSMQGASTVSFNGVAASVTGWSPTGIAVIVPVGAASGPVVVTVGGTASNGVGFTIPGPPNVTSVYPAAGLVGTVVTITGMNFGATQGTSVLTFGSSVGTPTSWNQTQIIAAVPSGAQSGNVQVTASGITGSAAYFNVLAAPVISSLSPNSGPVSPITINGNGFGATQGMSVVTFNGVAATPTSWSATSIVVPPPNGVITGPVVVTVSGVASNSLNYTAAPSITSVSANSGVIGNSITITGTNLATAVQVNFLDWVGQECRNNVTSATSTTVVATIPACAASGPVGVVYNGSSGTNESNTLPFTVNPTVTSISPNPGIFGSTVQINGGPFGFPQGSSTVTFGGTVATPSTWQPTYLVVNPPANFTSGNVVVTVNGVATAPVSFSVSSNPVISGLSPNAGEISSTVTINGSNFGNSQGTSSVTFNGVTAAPSAWSNSAITVTVPAGATTGNVVVTVQGVASVGVPYTVTGPVINNLNPTAATVGQIVNINGVGFGVAQGTSTVTFNGVPATPNSWSPTQIVTYPPPTATSGNVIVTVGGVASNAQAFTVNPGPVISNISPSTTTPGSTFTINGSHFGSITGLLDNTGDPLRLSCSTWTDTAITCKVATNSPAGTDNVWVTDVNFNDSNHLKFTVVLPLQITSLLPSSGVIGGSVTINGTSFGSTQGTSAISFNGLAATVGSWSDTAIVATTPTGATTGNVVVNVSGTASNGVKFTVVPAPSISALSPTSGPIGEVVTVTGANFGSTQGTSSVSFNGVAASPVSWATGTIKVPVPAGTSTGPVTVTVGNGTSNGSTFTLSSGPGITALTPSAGGIGATVAISGAGFGATQGTSVVKFNGITATATSWSDGSVLVSVPSGATTGNVVVTAGGVSSNGVAFTVASGLSVTSVSPTSGNTGETVSITGTGFGTSQGSSSVTFNGTSATITSWTSTLITASVPAAATSGPVVVTVGGAPSDPVSFTIQPQINGISPQPAALGATVTLTGENFGASQGNGQITCNGTLLGAGDISSWSASSIVVSGCATNLGPNPIQITVNRVSSTTAAVNGIPDPILSKVVPQTAPVGAAIKIIGKNFGNKQGQSTVSINGVTAAPTSWSDGSIAVSVPSGATGSGPINVMVGGQSAYPTIYFQVGTYGVPNSVKVTPANVNMLVGDLKQFTAVDDLGRPRPEATWTIDNASLATITADSSPVLTALAAGTVTLTATVQNVAAQTTVTISSLGTFPSGTPLWSAPPATGFSLADVVQAVPTDYGPDLYSIQTSSDGSQTLVQALTADGQQLWETTLPFPYGGNSVADGFGGVLIKGACDATNSIPMSLSDLEPYGGTVLWQTTLSSTTPGVCPSAQPTLAITQDGAVVVTPSMGVSPALLVLDGLSGQELTLTPAIPPSTITDAYGTANTCDCFTPVGPAMVDSDGTTYFEYLVQQASHYFVAQPVSSILYLMKVAPDGTNSSTQLQSSNLGYLWPGSIIPDGSGGVVATWVEDHALPPQAVQPYQAAHVSGEAVRTYPLPLAPASINRDPNTGIPFTLSLVLGENGTAFVSYLTNITSFNLNTGQQNWNYAAGQSSTLSLVSYNNGGGLVAKSTANGIDTVLRFDPAGNATADSWTASNSDYDPDQDLWFGSSVLLGLADYTAPGIDSSPSLFPMPKQKRLNRAYPISVVVRFVNKNRKVGDDGDNLSFVTNGNIIFPPQPDCTEALGPVDCSSVDTWRWNLEGKAVSRDPISNWSVQQSVHFKLKSSYRDQNNNLQSFSCPATGVGFVEDDGPRNPSIQVQGNTFFWIDAPGSFASFNASNPCGGPGPSLLDSLLFAASFEVKYTNKVSSYQRIVRHYIVLRVSSGRVVNDAGAGSKGDYGSIPLNF